MLKKNNGPSPQSRVCCTCLESWASTTSCSFGVPCKHEREMSTIMLLLSKTMVLNRLQNEIASAIFYHSLLLLLEETAAKWLSPQNMLGWRGALSPKHGD